MAESSVPTTVDLGADGLRSRKVSELLAKRLVDEIIQERMPEGTALPTERAMMEQYGLGRSTVREALRLLETRGVVSIKQGINGGPVVRHPRASDLSVSLSLILSFAGASLADLLTTRLTIEPVLAGLAARRVQPSDIAELRDSVERMNANLKDQTIFVAENERFHTAIARVGGNPVLLALIESVKGISDGMAAGIAYTDKRRLGVVRAHKRIVDALETGTEESAVAEMRQHLEEAGRYWRKEYGGLYNKAVNWRV
jgi:GntR family transcriptional regulator, transcriptional repressor for pyruvate dehydrogenase complex